VRLKPIASLLAFSIFLVQTVAAVAQVVTPQAGAPASITIPAGKVIPLTLVSPIRSKSTRVGDLVRAQVAFPITVGTQIVIPAGTFVEGTVQAVAAKKTKSNPGGLQIHFTRLIYANGYSVPLDAVNTHSQLAPELPGLPPDASAAFATTGALGVGFGWGATPVPNGIDPFIGQSTPTPTLPALPGPPKGFIIAVAVGAAIFIAVLIISIFAHHRNNNDYVLYDSGYQMQMALTVPVTVDTAQVSAAASSAPN
jgi:hypothetical protein